jgi:hypothetical protein
MTVFHDEYRSTLGRTLSDRVATFLDNLPSYDRLQLARVSQALHVLAVLGIPDRLADGPCSSQDLAAFVRAADEPLYRLLRAMAAIGVLEELPERRFALSEGLRSDVSGSLAGWEPSRASPPKKRTRQLRRCRWQKGQGICHLTTIRR